MCPAVVLVAEEAAALGVTRGEPAGPCGLLLPSWHFWREAMPGSSDVTTSPWLLMRVREWHDSQLTAMCA